MKTYKFSLLLILICLSFENKGKEKIRKLDDQDTYEPETDDTSEIDVDTDIASSNSTEDDGTTFSTEITPILPEDQIHYNVWPLLILEGFGNFRISTPSPALPRRIGLFTVFFKRILGDQVLTTLIIIPMTITYNSRFRFLEENTAQITENVNATCNRTTPDQEDNIQFNCTFPIRNESDLNNAETHNDKIIYYGMEGAAKPNITISTRANSTSKNLQTETGNDLAHGIYLYNETVVLNKKDLNFLLNGYFESFRFNGNKVILSFDESGNGENIVNATCDVEYLGGEKNKANLNCTADKSIYRGKLTGVTGVSPDTGSQVLVYSVNKDQTLTLGNNNLYYSKSSSGLSGGAIAAIVIAAIVALIAIAIVAILCTKSKAKAPFQESTLGINGFNSNTNIE